MGRSGWLKQRYRVLAFGGAMLLGAAWAVWGFARGERTGFASDPRKAEIVKGTYEDVIRRSGTLQPVSQERILPQVRGTILRIVHDGMRVEKGAALLELDPRPHEEALARQVAALRRMRAERERDKRCWLPLRKELETLRRSR